MNQMAERERCLRFESGSLSKEEAEAIIERLPVDITFADEEDKVRYFTKFGKGIFPRAKTILGAKLQRCHSKKSIRMVNEILEAFKTGKRDVAEFWMNLQNRVIHTRYFSVRNENGDYLGVLEVNQDITDIKEIEGEKRLLDRK